MSVICAEGIPIAFVMKTACVKLRIAVNVQFKVWICMLPRVWNCWPLAAFHYSYKLFFQLLCNIHTFVRHLSITPIHNKMSISRNSAI